MNPEHTETVHFSALLKAVLKVTVHEASGRLHLLSAFDRSHRSHRFLPCSPLERVYRYPYSSQACFPPYGSPPCLFVRCEKQCLYFLRDYRIPERATKREMPCGTSWI